MNTYHDVVVTGVDEETSEVVRPGVCELVFTLNENPPPAWRELFRRITHDRANGHLEHAQFRAGMVIVGVPLLRAADAAEELLGAVRETNGAFREEHAELLREQAVFAEAVALIQTRVAGEPRPSAAGAPAEEARERAS